MFSFLKFKMENSFGVPVLLKLEYKNKFLLYEICQEKIAECENEHENSAKAQNQVLRKEKTENFIQKWGKISCNDMFQHIGQISNAKEDDFWFLEIGYDTLVTKMSGGKSREEPLSPFIELLSELLDETFEITHFVKSSRIERIEIELYEPFETPKTLAFLGNLGLCGHEEYVCLDRASMTLSYSGKNPSNYVNHSYKCFCENEIRSILDRTSVLLESGNLLKEEDCLQKSEAFSNENKTNCQESSSFLKGAQCLKNGTYVGFVFHFYDGSKKIVKKKRVNQTVGSIFLDELISIIGSAIVFTLFDNSLFDFETNQKIQ